MYKNILICALGGKTWIGGIYYVKNLLFQLSISDRAADKYRYYMFANSDIINEFSEFVQKMKIVTIECNETEDVHEQLILACDDNNIDVVLPVSGGGYTWIIKDISLYWIPDFQEIHLPENFSVDDIEERRLLKSYIAKEHKGLILSSKDSYNDYKNQYPDNTENVFIVHFVSYISPLVRQITRNYEKDVLNKYGIEYDYIFVANQFWKHKNHIVVLKAMNEIINGRNKEIHLVCTGFMQSYGTTDVYVNSLYQYIEEHNLNKFIHFLGLLERKEQLCIMKNARLLIQPSKFEGWGCSVEDAKVMGKWILLSDIEVHKEQQYSKSMLFPRDNSSALSTLIMDNFEKDEKYDLEYGNQYMMEKARQYSLELQSAIDSIEIKERKDYLEELYRLREKKVLQLFGDLPSNRICIYGVGWLTEQIFNICGHALKDCEFVYSDSDDRKWGKKFKNGKIYPPSELINLGIKRIVISSIKYQEEIYESIKEYEKEIEIVKIYNTDKEKNEPLWIRGINEK